MIMLYYPKGKVPVKYNIVTDPPEALYWETYQLKKSDIKILTKLDRTSAAKMRDEILNDILKTEKTDVPKKPAPRRVTTKR